MARHQRRALALLVTLTVGIAAGSELTVTIVSAESDLDGAITRRYADPPATPTTTPNPTVSPDQSPDPTPTADTTTAPSEEPGVLFDAVITASMEWDQAEHFQDQPGLTWTGQFEGARLVHEDPVQTSWLGMWELDVQAPGASVRAVVSAGPADVYRVIDAYCLDSKASTRIPSVHEGQSLEFEFEAIPDGGSEYECYFTFDPAFLPQPTPVPSDDPPPASVSVTFKPAIGRPGQRVLVSGLVCGLYQGYDQILFSDRFVPRLPDGQTAFFKPAGVAALSPVGGEQTDMGISTTRQSFVVPKVPAGDYHLYASCSDADACCLPLEPTFGVGAAPETSTEVVLRPRGDFPWLSLGLAFTLGYGMVLIRSRFRRRIRSVQSESL
jgi:hypothetical protein